MAFEKTILTDIVSPDMEWLILNQYLYSSWWKLIQLLVGTEQYKESDNTIGFPTLNTLWHITK